MINEDHTAVFLDSSVAKKGVDTKFFRAFAVCVPLSSLDNMSRKPRMVQPRVNDRGQGN